ncbi:hypothetical protein, partial [Rathayibacter rathayi]
MITEPGELNVPRSSDGVGRAHLVQPSSDWVGRVLGAVAGAWPYVLAMAGEALLLRQGDDPQNWLVAAPPVSAAPPRPRTRPATPSSNSLALPRPEGLRV